MSKVVKVASKKVQKEAMLFKGTEIVKISSKKVVKDAIKFEGVDGVLVTKELSDYLGRGSNTWHPNPGDGTIRIVTPEGEMICRPGDYIIKGLKGEFYPINPEVFAKTYEILE